MEVINLERLEFIRIVSQFHIVYSFIKKEKTNTKLTRDLKSASAQLCLQFSEFKGNAKSTKSVRDALFLYSHFFKVI